jgi:hypothetical protein
MLRKKLNKSFLNFMHFLSGRPFEKETKKAEETRIYCAVGILSDKGNNLEDTHFLCGLQAHMMYVILLYRCESFTRTNKTAVKANLNSQIVACKRTDY